MKALGLFCGAVVIAAVIGVMNTPRTQSPKYSAQPPGSDQGEGEKAATEDTIQGEVREVIEVAEYTYLRLSRANGSELWAAVAKAPVAVGAKVTITSPAQMTQFESKTLKRTFDVIYFGNLERAGQTPGSGAALPPGHPAVGAPGPHGGLAASPHSPHSPVPAPSAELAEAPVRLASGPNARSISSLFTQRAELSGKPVRVRARIVKATPIQGVTYYRVRDGSSQGQASKELVIRSTAQAQIGDVVTFEGRVSIDADVGIGSKYPVLLEDAKLVAK